MPKEAQKKKLQEFIYRNTRNVYYVNWGQWNSNKMLKEKIGRHARKTLKSFTKTRQICYL